MREEKNGLITNLLLSQCKRAMLDGFASLEDDMKVREYKELFCERDNLRQENSELKQMVNSPSITFTTCPKCNYHYELNYCREVHELKQENEKVKEFKCERTDCVGRLGSSRFFQKQKEKLDKIEKLCESNPQKLSDGLSEPVRTQVREARENIYATIKFILKEDREDI